jgi:hypothetical protein
VKLGLTQREENRLKEYENKVLRRIFGPKMKWQEDDCIRRNFITCMVHQISLGLQNQGGIDG